MSAAADPETRNRPQAAAGTFDVVALLRQSVRDDPVGLRRLGRLLTGDGSMVAAVPNMPTAASGCVQPVCRRRRRSSRTRHRPGAADGVSVKQLFERAGFVVTERAVPRSLRRSPGAQRPTVPPALIQQLATDIDALVCLRRCRSQVAVDQPGTLQLRVRQLAVDRDIDRRRSAVSSRSDEQSVGSLRLEKRHEDLSSDVVG